MLFMTAPSPPAPSPSPGASTGHALEWHAPTLTRIDERTTIPALLQARVSRSADRPLIAHKQETSGVWRTITAREFSEEVDAVASGLIGMGLEPGERVAIMSRTRYEWTLLDFACWTAALVPVPIYETSSAEQIAHVLADSEARLIVTETITMAELVRTAAVSVGRESPSVLSLDAGAIRTITENGRDVPASVLAERTESLRTSSLATIVYTSGTTGTPKGTVLSHGNFTDLCTNAHQWMPEIAMGLDSRLLLFLPLAHVFARFLQVFQISGEGVIGHAPDTKNLLPDLAAFRPSYLLVVPRVLEKIYNSADARAASGSARKVFRWAAKVAVDYSRSLDAPTAHQVRAQHERCGFLPGPLLADPPGDGVGQVGRHQATAQTAHDPGGRGDHQQRPRAPGRALPDLLRRVRERPPASQAPAGSGHHLRQVLARAVLPAQNHGAHRAGVGDQGPDVQVTGGVGVLHGEGFVLEQLSAPRAQRCLPAPTARTAGRQPQ